MPDPARIFNPYRFFGNTPVRFKTDSSGIQRLSEDDRNLMIDVHGYATNVKTPEAKAAYGVYFGGGSRHNECGLLPEGMELFTQVSSQCPGIAWYIENGFAVQTILMFEGHGTLRLTI
jgi:hypothetical protein